MAARPDVIVVDTSVWAAFFNGGSALEAPPVRHQEDRGGSAGADTLDRLLATDEVVAIIPIILMEVLQGFRSDEGFNKARGQLTRLPVLVPSLETHVLAARLYRGLRRRGATVRGTIDCLIAELCIETAVPLLTADRDFERIAQHTTLQLVH